MRAPLAIVLAGLTFAGLSAVAAPPAATLSATSSPPAFDPAEQKQPEQLPFPDPAPRSEDNDCRPETDGRPSFLRFLLRVHDRSLWRETGHHPRMFGKAIPMSRKEPKAGAPTTLPQAIRKYFECLRTHGEALKVNANGSKKEENSNGGKAKENDQEKDKGGESDRLDGGQTSTTTNAQPGGGQSPPADQLPSTLPPPFDALGAERGGRSINIAGETGLQTTGYTPTWYSAHGQGTVVDSVHDHFHSPYSGPLSLQRVEPHAVSETTTFFFAARLWEGADWVFNPEVAGGRGLSGSNGVAGFPNGEITRVGLVEPTPYFARCFIRQTIGFGGEQEKLEDGVNQIAGTRDVNHFTIAAGRFSMTDVVDDNRYSHDPRTQFLAWSIMYNGAWDYPANVRGYTDAIALDFNQKYWALHYAIAAEPSVANGSALDPHFLKANGQVLELLRRYKINDHPGNLRLLTYLNRAHMGDYREALNLMPVDPNVTLTRSYRYKYGFGLSWDQEVTRDIGIWTRLGWSDGHTEAWAFTPIDRTAVIGTWINGRSWCRPNDQYGLAFCANGLAKDHRDYLAAGGLDFNIGDGKLNYGREMILESLYNLGITKNILFTLDFQEVWNPAYNRDRGPVSIFQGRFHIEF